MESEKKESILTGRKFQIKPTLLHRFLEIQAEEDPEAIALIYDDGVAKEQISFGELNARSNRMGNHILKVVKDNNLKANNNGDWIVAICMKPSIDLITSMLAIWKAGAGYLPIDVDFPGVRIQHILNEAKPLVVFYGGDFEHGEVLTGVRAYRFEDFIETSADMSCLNLVDDKTVTKGVNNMAAFIYTSGSTGKPKGVRIRHVTAQQRLEWQWSAFPFAETEQHFVFKSAMIFIDHFAEVWGPLLKRKTLVIIPKDFKQNPEKFVPILEKYKISRLVTVPALINAIILYLSMEDESGAKEGGEVKPKLPHLKLWISSGEQLTPKLAKNFFDCFDDGQRVLCTFYGSTEVMGDVLFFQISSKVELAGLERIPIGKPVNNTRIYILDERKRPVMQGEVGEICVAGAFLSDGYIEEGEDEPEVITKNPLSPLVTLYWYLYHTGDFGTMSNGLVYYNGRRDSQINVNGHRVEMTEVENLVDGLTYLERSVVQVCNKGLENQEVLAFMKLKGSYNFMTVADIEEDIRKKIPSYMMPKVVLLNQFPFLPSGKADVQRLLKNYEDQRSDKVAEKEPVVVDLTGVTQDAMEKTLTVFKIIGDSIGSVYDKISRTSNFYAIGGNSMNTILCVRNLRKANYEISIADFLSAVNIGEIIDKLVVVEAGRVSQIEIPDEMVLITEPLKNNTKAECISMLSSAFLEKGELDRFINGLQFEHFINFLEPNWEFFIQKDLSFVVRDVTDKIVGVSVNYEVGDEPRESGTPSPLDAIMGYLNFVEREAHITEKTADDKVLESFMMATTKTLSSAQNIQVMSFMEKEILRRAKDKSFKAIVTTNTNQLTQQIGEEVYGYKTLKEFQINRYVDKSGNRPFQLAKDFQKTMTMWKDIDE